MQKKNLFDTTDEWNAVGGYYDELTYRNHLYYDASLTPGVADDLEAFKRLWDHCFCKVKARITKKVISQLYYYKEYVKRAGDSCYNVVDWFDHEIKLIERSNTNAMSRRQEDESPLTDDLILQSNAKKRLRELHRELMLIMQLLGAFDKERKIKRPADLFKEHDQFEDEEVAF